MITDQKILNKIPNNCYCGLCNKPIYKYDKEIEYVKTRRRTESFYHTECINRYSKIGVNVNE